MADWTADKQGIVVKTTELLMPEIYREDPIEERLAQARAQVAQLTPSLLAKAFRGELMLQDPEDILAANSMDRITGKKQLFSSQIPLI